MLTHCNAGWLATVDVGTATAPIYMAHDNGIAIHVFADETRPRNQGASLTAWELGQHGVPHTLIADNTGGHLMQHGLVDLVIVGTDRVTANGDVCNKIGTYLKALAARDNNVPFYVALPSPTIDFTVADGVAEIPIEERSPDEVATMTGRTADGRIETVRIAPAGTPVANYAFDVTPARLVTGLITERGVIAASRAGAGGGFSGARRRGRMRGIAESVAQSECVACVSSKAGVRPNLPLPGILTMSVNLLPAAPPVDGRQSPTALAIARGTARFLHALGYSRGERTAAAVGPPRRPRCARWRRRNPDRGDQIVGRRFPRRPEMDGLPAALRPAVLRHRRRRSAARYFPPTPG